MGRVLYRCKDFYVEEYACKINGRTRVLQRIIEPDIVVVLPFLDRDTVLLEKQYRHPIGKWLYELPAGHIDKGESAMAAARRELKEETGYAAGIVRKMFSAYSNPGLNTAVRNYFYAAGLKQGNRHLEPTEEIRTEKVKFSWLSTLIKNNSIVDEKTIAAVSYYKEYVKTKRAHV
ncbi:MAG: NUDIX hydrolase [Candidatus Micrarchaeaceae archaeon]